MTPSLERLLEVAKSERAMSLIDGAFLHVMHGGVWQQAMAFMADRLCSMYGLSAEIKQHGIVFYSAMSRAKHPACLIVSRQRGQSPSPSATYYRSGALALIQVFEGDADDSDVAGDCPDPTHWVETKGRLLLN